MNTPTPKDTPPFDPPVFCSGIERDCKHGQLARSCHICELERELAAAQEARNAAVAEASRWQNSFHAMTERAQAAEARAEASERALAEIREEWAGSECGEPVTAQEAYAIGLCNRMYQIAVAAIASVGARSVRDAIRAAVAQERERCAKVCDDLHKQWQGGQGCCR